jgi:hypothetical protein
MTGYWIPLANVIMVVDSQYQCPAGFSTVQRPSKLETWKEDDVSEAKGSSQRVLRVNSRTLADNTL